MSAAILVTYLIAVTVFLLIPCYLIYSTVKYFQTKKEERDYVTLTLKWLILGGIVVAFNA